jgi:chromosome segregation ATPase
MEAYTIPEAARAAGLSAREVRVRIEEGDLRAFIQAGQRMVERAEIARLTERPAITASELRTATPPAAPTRALEDLVAEVRRLEQDLGEARRDLSRARERIAELESDGARTEPARDQREALTPLFRSTEPRPS